MAAPDNAASMDLALMATVKQWLEKGDDTSEDQILAQLIDRASKLIETFCRREFKYESRTELYDGTGTAELWTRCAPIDSAVAPTVEYLYDGTTWETQDNDLIGLRYADPEKIGYLWLSSGLWPAGLQNIRLTYTAGYATSAANLPHDLQQAALEVVEELYARFRDRKHMSPSVQFTDGTTTQFISSVIPKTAMDVLYRYRLAA